MRPLLAATLLLTVAAAAHAQSVRLGGKIIKTGMDVNGVMAAVGDPTAITELINEFGGPEGMLLFYRFDGYNKRTVVIQADAYGEVVRIEQCLGQLADACR